MLRILTEWTYLGEDLWKFKVPGNTLLNFLLLLFAKKMKAMITYGHFDR